MTGKRFMINKKITLNKIETYQYVSIIDTETKNFYFVIDDLANVESFVERLNKLTEENEELKQYIYDNLDEDICDVCIHQYLKPQQDGYYVAKCKKGYDNCSKGTVIVCNDLEFKELKE